MQIPQLDREWFVVRTKPGCEQLAADELRCGGHETYLPMRRIRNFYRRGRVYTNQHKPAWEGYLFLASPAGRTVDWGRFRDDIRFRHVGSPLKDARGFPHHVPGSLVVAISVAEMNGRYDEVGAHDKLAERFVEGGEFVVTDGPFAGFRALVDGVTSSELVRVLVNLFGRHTSLTLDPSQLDEVA